METERKKRSVGSAEDLPGAAFLTQNHRTLTEDIQDVFEPQIVEELSEDEEIPQENVVANPVPGLLMEIVRATFTLALSSAGCNRSGPTAEGTC